MLYLTMNMSEDFFASSDTGRSGAPLKHVQTVTFDQPLALERGGALQPVTVAYETYGRLSDARDNVVLICHALSGDSHVAAHDADDDPGWWDLAIGPGKIIDTDTYFVICPNILGGCRGTTGPGSTNPATGRPFGAEFPTITVGDMVTVQTWLLDHMGIDKLLAVIGGSMGGHQALHWAAAHSDRTRGVIPVATSPFLSSRSRAFDIVGRNAIRRDPSFHGGQYYDKDTGPEVGLAIARMIGHITYLSVEAMQKKFGDDGAPRDVPVDFEKAFTVGSYLGFKGAEFVERFDANSYVALTMAVDLFNLGRSAEALESALGETSCRWLIMSFTSDWLFLPAESRQIVDALIRTNRPVNYCNVRSEWGHDAFLLPYDLDGYGGLIQAFLANLSGNGGDTALAPEDGDHHPASIFHPSHPQRLDTERIVGLIPPEATVLDLGCGNGELLAELAARGHRRIMGVELDQQAVIACVGRGVNVVQGDLNEGLDAFGDKQFDCVVVSRTLQAVMDVERLIDDILRVGKQCIVSFPNFGYYKLREMLYTEGRAPEAPGVLSHKWYNTPNIRVLSIADFEDLCRERGITVHQAIALDTEKQTEVTDDPNLTADLAIFVISR